MRTTMTDMAVVYRRPVGVMRQSVKPQLAATVRGRVAAELIVGFSDGVSLIDGGHDLDNYLLAAVATDCFMRVPAIRVAEARIEAGEADTWMYRFDHESPSFAGRLGAAHAVELPYVFDLLDDEGSHALIGDAPPQAVADTAHGAWVRFVADGDPGWPRYNLAERATALIDEGITVVDDPAGAERDVWAGRR